MEPAGLGEQWRNGPLVGPYQENKESDCGVFFHVEIINFFIQNLHLFLQFKFQLCLT